MLMVVMLLSSSRVSAETRPASAVPVKLADFCTIHHFAITTETYSPALTKSRTHHRSLRERSRPKHSYGGPISQALPHAFHETTVHGPAGWARATTNRQHSSWRHPSYLVRSNFEATQSQSRSISGQGFYVPVTVARQRELTSRRTYLAYPPAYLARHNVCLDRTRRRPSVSTHSHISTSSDMALPDQTHAVAGSPRASRQHAGLGAAIAC